MKLTWSPTARWSMPAAAIVDSNAWRFAWSYRNHIGGTRRPTAAVLLFMRRPCTAPLSPRWRADYQAPAPEWERCGIRATWPCGTTSSPTRSSGKHDQIPLDPPGASRATDRVRPVVGGERPADQGSHGAGRAGRTENA